MPGTNWAFQLLGQTIATGVDAMAIVSAGLALLCAACLAVIRRARRRSESSGSPEVLFAGRWGARGPELFLVDAGVRRLLPGKYGRKRLPAERHPAEFALARAMLTEVLRCCPATRLARAFADARLSPLTEDGFVLSVADVEAWLAAGQAAATVDGSTAA